MKPTTLAFLLAITVACVNREQTEAPSATKLNGTTVMSAGSDAQSAAAAFYTEVRRERISGLPTTVQLKRLTPYLTPELVAGFEHAATEQRDYMRKHPDDKPPLVEGDLFSSLFEGVSSWKQGTAKVNGSTAEVPVQLTYSGDGQTSRWTDTLLLKKTADGWRVADIRMGGEWAFKAGGNTLSQTLSAKP